MILRQLGRSRARRLLFGLGAGVVLGATGLGSAPGDPTDEAKAPGRDRVGAADRLASTGNGADLAKPRRPDDPGAADAAKVRRALAAIAECRSRYESVDDYTCTFYKRERMADGRLTLLYSLTMKARVRPQSFYLKFISPKKGREGIYVAGKNGGRVLVHDVGIGKLLAGTLKVDPKGSMAMEDSRHPITDAGIGHLIERLDEGWKAELRPGDTHVVFHTGAAVDRRPCTMIETTHPVKRPGLQFHRVKLYVDQGFGLPVRFEAYDWPRRPGAAAELVEEYTYTDLKLNAGLTDRDFDPANSSYSFGRF